MEEIVAEEKPFPKIRKFVVVFNTRFYHRALFLSGGLIAVSSQDDEYLSQEFSTGNTVEFKLLNESGRYIHEERISRKRSLKLSLMYWELDELVKFELWKEKEVVGKDTK